MGHQNLPDECELLSKLMGPLFSSARMPHTLPTVTHGELIASYWQLIKWIVKNDRIWNLQTKTRVCPEYFHSLFCPRFRDPRNTWQPAKPPVCVRDCRQPEGPHSGGSKYFPLHQLLLLCYLCHWLRII